MVRSVQPAVDHELESVTDSRKQDDALIARYIAPRRYEDGRANAYLPDYGYRVAALIAYLQSVNNDVQETARSYQLPEEAMLAAIAFYRQNRAVIDARILLDIDQWDSSFQHRG